MFKYAICPDCGRMMYTKKNLGKKQDGETYTCYHCSGVEYSEDEPEEFASVEVAAELWALNGKDPNLMFGYTEAQLEAAL